MPDSLSAVVWERYSVATAVAAELHQVEEALVADIKAQSAQDLATFRGRLASLNTAGLSLRDFDDRPATDSRRAVRWQVTSSNWNSQATATIFDVRISLWPQESNGSLAVYTELALNSYLANGISKARREHFAKCGRASSSDQDWINEGWCGSYSEGSSSTLAATAAGELREYLDFGFRVCEALFAPPTT